MRCFLRNYAIIRANYNANEGEGNKNNKDNVDERNPGHKRESSQSMKI